MATSILRLPVRQSPHRSFPQHVFILRVAQGTFPKPVSLGGRAVGWIEAEVQRWLEQRIEASRKAAS